MVKNTRKHSKKGGGWEFGPKLSQEAYYVPEYKNYSDCQDQARPGALTALPNPGLAQTIMAGGAYRNNCVSTRPIGSIQSNPNPELAQKAMQGGCGCAFKRGGSRRRTRSRLLRNRKSKRRNMRGGRFAIDTSQSIGGDGPNVAPIYPSVPCEAHRPMPLNPASASMLADGPIPDVDVSGLRPAFIMKGGNGHPLSYTAPRAGYTFQPNIAQGQVLNPGQIPYEEVIPQTDTCNSQTCGQAIASISR